MDCRKQLGQLHEQKDAFAARGAKVVAVSVDTADLSIDLAKRLDIDVSILYGDQTGLAARVWDVWDPETEIALAATFIVAEGGEVIFRWIGGDKTDRPPMATLLAALDEQNQ